MVFCGGITQISEHPAFMKMLSWLFLKSYSCGHSKREKAVLVSAALSNRAALVFWYSFQIPAWSVAHWTASSAACQNSWDLTLARACLGYCRTVLASPGSLKRGLSSGKLICRMAEIFKMCGKMLAFWTAFALSWGLKAFCIIRFSCNIHFTWSLEGVLRCQWVCSTVAVAGLCPQHLGDAAALQTLPHAFPCLLSLPLKAQAGFPSWYKRMIRETCCVKAKALLS